MFRSSLELGSDEGESKTLKVLSFLAHNAPVVPDWFDVKMRQKPVVPEPLNEVYGLPSRHEYSSYFRYFCESDFSWQKYDPFTLSMLDMSRSIPPEYKTNVELHQLAINEQSELLAIWEKEHNELLFFSWRIYYARELLTRLLPVDEGLK